MAAGNCEIQALFVSYVEATVIQWRQTETRRSNKVDWTNFTNKSQRVSKSAHYWSRASSYDFLIDTSSSLDTSVEVTSSLLSRGLSSLWRDSGLNNKHVWESSRASQLPASPTRHASCLAVAHRTGRCDLWQRSLTTPRTVAGKGPFDSLGRRRLSGSTHQILGFTDPFFNALGLHACLQWVHYMMLGKSQWRLTFPWHSVSRKCKSPITCRAGSPINLQIAWAIHEHCTRLQ